MKNYIIELANEAGYKNEGNNRQRVIKNLNLLIDAGVLRIKFIDADKYNNKDDGRSFWFMANDGFKRCTNYKFELYGKFFNGHFVAKKTNTHLNLDKMMLHIVRKLASVKTEIDFMKETIYAKHGNCSCSKCDGQGIIPAFSYYANGVCFDCGGMGINRSVLSTYIQETINLVK
jgi:hypothetical protein